MTSRAARRRPTAATAPRVTPSWWQPWSGPRASSYAGPIAATRPPRASLTACIIALNEEQRLPACLDSVAFADEIVVVDSGSRDRTREIADARGAIVVEHPWQGFAKQRNVAIANARGDWILEVDADERVSPELQREIREFVDDPVDGIDLGALPLRDEFLGGGLGPSTKYPRYRLRLFLRGRYQHDEARTVHEGLNAQDRVWPFTGDLQHVLAADWGEALTDAWAYSRLEAAQLARRPGVRALLLGVVARPSVKFAYRLVVHAGWRDGRRGVARIALECASDALVWVHRLRIAPERPQGGGRAETSGTHFSVEAPAAGRVRLIAVALGRERAAAAAEWLLEAAAAGADVALVTDSPEASDGPLHVRALEGSGPFALVRALDAERQLRHYDALILVGSFRSRLLRLLAPSVYGRIGRPLSLRMDPAAALRAVAAETRTGLGDEPGRDQSTTAAQPV